MADKDRPLVVVENLRTHFPIKTGVFKKTVSHVRAVDDVSLTIRKGETLGLVGETGCGKTTLGRSILWLQKPTGGKVYFDGTDLSGLSQAKLRSKRQEMQMIFENPYSSIDPGMKVREIIAEPLQIHNMAAKDELEDRARELLVLVGLDADMVKRYPSELSGGQRQRVELARALALQPNFIVCDNPLAHLDVSMQAQLTQMLIWLRNWRQLTYLFIAHDLALVRRISHRVAVMYLGQFVEIAETDELFDNPQHPYTQALISAVPVPDPAERDRKVLLLPGEPPSPVDPPSGCRFHPRCNIAIKKCSQTVPDLREIDHTGHKVACHLV